MKALIPLTKIGFFNPGRLTDQEIEDAFVARIPFFNYLFEKITSEKPGSIPQQYLVIGQRGMGKSSLLVRIAAELRKSIYRSSFIPLSFPEEQYNVDRLSKFWLNCLDAVADALDKEGKSAYLEELDVEIRRLSKEASLNANLVYEEFEKWINKLGRRPVLLIDNLDLIFSKINKEEQHQLRAVLISKGAPILVGASATPVDETLDYQAPFYDAFQISYLKKLSFPESFDVLLNLAKITGNDHFQYEVHRQRGRLEVLYQLTGGTPRTLTILFPLIQNGFSDNIQTDLDALLDLITPLYKARFEELPSQLQVILDAVALNWDPMNLQKLREVTMLDNAQLSPQLKRLVDIGWLQRLDAYKAKGGAYELSERFFNVWYLMRRSSRRQKRELYCLTKFLESFYGNALHEIAQSRIDSKSNNLDHIALDLALADALKDKIVGRKLRRKSFDALLEMSATHKNLFDQFTISEEMSQEIILDHYNQSVQLVKDGKEEEAEACLMKVLRINDRSSLAWSILGAFRLYIVSKYETAMDALQKAVALNAENGTAWGAIGEIYKIYYKDYEKSEQAYLKAIQYESKHTSALRELADLYANYLQRYKEAEELIKKALYIDKKDADLYSDLARIYIKLGEYHLSELNLDKAAKLGKSDALAWYEIAFLYSRSLNRFEDSERAYKKGISLDEEPFMGYYGLGILYNHYDDYVKAENAYLKALQIKNDSSEVWNTLGRLYMFFLKDFSKADVAFRTALEIDPKQLESLIGLGELFAENKQTQDRAEDLLKQVIILDPNSKDGWVALGNLYGRKLARYDDAEEAYLKAIEFGSNSLWVWTNLGYLNAEYLNDFEKAEWAYLKAIEIDSSNSWIWSNLGDTYMRLPGKVKDAERCYKEAVLIDPDIYEAWNGLGNIYSDYLKEFTLAENAYNECLRIDPSDETAKYNLVFLLRDRIGDVDRAKAIFQTIQDVEGFRYCLALNQSVFAYYDKNIGYAEAYFKEALRAIGEQIPIGAKDDWYRALAVIIKLGFGESVINVFRALGYDVILRPLYIAMEALIIFRDPNYLDSIAAEIREPAKQILETLEILMK